MNKILNFRNATHSLAGTVSFTVGSHLTAGWLAAVLLVMTAATPLHAQQRITLDEAIGKALRDYPSVRASRLQARSAAMLGKSASALGEMEISGGGEEIGRGNDAVYTLARVRQSIDPFGAGGLRQRLQAQARVAEAETGVAERTLSRQVSLDYINDYAAQLRCENMARTDSLYADFAEVARQRYETQAISPLEYQTALNRSQQVRLALAEAQKDLGMAHANLSRWLSADTLYMAAGVAPGLEPAAIMQPDSHPEALLSQQRIQLSQATVKEMRAQRQPKFFVEAGVQKIGPTAGYYAWQVGISVPIAVGATKASVRSAAIALERSEADAEETRRQLGNRLATLRMTYDKYAQSVDYYRSHALPLAREQQRIASLSYRAGSIGYLDFIQAVNDALTTEMSYVEAYTRMLESKYQLLYY